MRTDIFDYSSSSSSSFVTCLLSSLSSTWPQDDVGGGGDEILGLLVGSSVFKAMHGCSEPGEMFSVQSNVWMLDIDQAKQCLDVRNQVGSSVFKCSEPGGKLHHIPAPSHCCHLTPIRFNDDDDCVFFLIMNILLFDYKHLMCYWYWHYYLHLLWTVSQNVLWTDVAVGLMMIAISFVVMICDTTIVV